MNTAGKYKPEWNSLITYKIPDWFLDSKFGIYAHWGLYAIPAFGNEWYAKHMYDPNNKIHQEHVRRCGPVSQFGYKDFIPQFKAEKFNPEAWAELLQTSGARYAGFSLSHHDGFGMWDSEVYRWNVGKMGPKRDLYGELVAELRKRNMRIVAPFHVIRGFNWYLPGYSQFDERFDTESIALGQSKNWDLYDPQYADFYWNKYTGSFDDFLKQWMAKVVEVIGKYQPDIMWFDGGKFREGGYEREALQVLSHYLNSSDLWGKGVCVLNKLPVNMKFNFHEQFGVPNFEAGRDRGADFSQRPWNDDMRIGDQSWGYVEGQQYVSGRELLHGLIDRVARGGSLMLSLSPMADGSIPEGQRSSIGEVGLWLSSYGEAIYHTRKWVVQDEGGTEKLITKRHGDHFGWRFDNCGPQDIRYTQSKDGKYLYAITLGWPGAEVQFAALGKKSSHIDKKIAAVSLLGSSEGQNWQHGEKALSLNLSKVKPTNTLAAVWKITFV